MISFSRSASRLLIVMLSTAFGLGAGSLGVYYGFCAAFGELGKDDWGAAPIWLMAMALGGLVGAFFMAVSSFFWTLDVHFRALRVFEWLGVVFGGLVGGTIFWMLPLRYYFWSRCVIIAALMPICVLVCCLAISGIASLLHAQANRAGNEL